MRLVAIVIAASLIAAGARPAFGSCLDFRDGTAEANTDKYSVEYFEEIFDTDLSVVGVVDDYKDPDQFFTAIAREVGIFDLAKEYIVKNFSDRRPKALLRYTNDCWIFLMFARESTDPPKFWSRALLITHEGAIEEMDGERLR